MRERIFTYHYGSEGKQYTFYRIPKALITDPYFKHLSTDAKLLYGLMLDRLSPVSYTHLPQSTNPPKKTKEKKIKITVVLPKELVITVDIGAKPLIPTITIANRLDHNVSTVDHK